MDTGSKDGIIEENCGKVVEISMDEVSKVD